MPTSRSPRGSGAPLILGLVVLLASAVVLATWLGPGRGASQDQPTPGSVAPAGTPPLASLLSAPPPTSVPTATLAARASGRPPIPEFGHVFVIVMENQGFGSIIGNPEAPYINGLASRYGLATGYTAVSHPSEPNYLALWSGSTQGVTDDAIHDFTSGTTLADQVEASGRSWHVAAENVPLGCYRGASASGGEDGGGTYARKHEPAISWTSVSGNAARCARITDFSRFDPNLGNLWFIAPNLCNDMHDCSIAAGDAFLKAWLPAILNSSAFSDGVVFLTWDEGSTSAGGGGRVATIVISPLAKPGFESATSHSHYSLLRTIEAAWRLPCLENACAAADLREFFR